MSKDAILHVIGTIQNPLKDDREKQEEEEEEDGPSEDAQGISAVTQPDTTTLATPRVRVFLSSSTNSVPDSHGVIRTLLMNMITHGKLIAPRQKRVRVRLLVLHHLNNLSRSHHRHHPRHMRRHSHNLLR